MGLRRSIVQLVLVAVFATIGVVLASGGPAAACSCVSANTAEHLADADAVFTGTVIGTPQASDRRSSESPSLQVDLEVDRVFKGDIGPSVDLTTAIDGAACGSDLGGGTRYLVFARRDDDGWTTDLCSGTRPVREGVLPAEIGAGAPPTPTSPATTEAAESEEVAAASSASGPGPILPIWPTIVIGVALALIVGWGVRRWELRRRT